jgi:hypothetical protein
MHPAALALDLGIETRMTLDIQFRFHDQIPF